MEVTIRSGELQLPGVLEIPRHARGIVLFAHGSGSSRRSPRNQGVAERLNDLGIATLLLDLLTEEEATNRATVFDIPLLGRRLATATRWIEKHPEAGHLPIGYFGASTGAAAALWAAAEFGSLIRAVVSRGGRPDLAGHRLRDVQAPTLLIVGGQDVPVLELNEAAHERLPHSELLVIPGATHLFEEPGMLEEVAASAGEWFVEQFPKRLPRAA